LLLDVDDPCLGVIFFTEEKYVRLLVHDVISPSFAVAAQWLAFLHLGRAAGRLADLFPNKNTVPLSRVARLCALLMPAMI
jgi:hypothetical protein